MTGLSVQMLAPATVCSGDMTIQSGGQWTPPAISPPAPTTPKTSAPSSLHWSCLYYDATNLGTCSSDERLKDNINDLTFSNEDGTALDKLTALQPRTFNWNNSTTTNYGLIAQEVMNIAPELVTTDEDGYYQNTLWLPTVSYP